MARSCTGISLRRIHERTVTGMDSHFLLVLLVSTVLLAAIYLSHVSIDQRIRELGAEQAKLSGIVAPREPMATDEDITFFKLADIMTGGQRAGESQGGMPTIIEEDDPSAREADPAEDPTEQVGVRKRKRGAGENKTGG